MRRVAALAALALTACGQTGPLYLPEDSGAVVSPAASPATPPPTSPATPPAADPERERKNESSTVPTPPP